MPCPVARYRRIMPARTIDIGGPFELQATLGAMTAKPVERRPPATGDAWWLSSTPAGPVSLRLSQRRFTVEGEAWGPGAHWALDMLDELLGLHDDPTAFDPGPGLVRELHLRRLGMRLGRTNRIFETLLPTILGQRVTAVEAKRAYRRIVATYGTPAPGPIDAWVPPEPEVIAGLGYADLHPLGVERSRAVILIEAARRASRLEQAAALPLEAARARLLALRGIGPWTVAQVMGAALGDTDAVPVGDYHIPNMVSWALAGEPRGDDDRMLELLEPYRGHRRRVVLLLKRAGIHAPRYGGPRLQRGISAGRSP